MDVADYYLPPEAVAQEPVEPRDAARMLVALELDQPIRHCRVADLPRFVGPGDVIVVNTSRVLPARLRLARPGGGAAEVLLLEPLEPSSWLALVRPGRRIPPGTVLVATGLVATGLVATGLVATGLVAAGRPVCEVGDRLDDGRRRVRLLVEEGEVDALLASIGAIPLPPYIRRPLADPERYQTVYAERARSVAAPTAGLHLTTAVLDACRSRGAPVVGLDLAVGLGTFRPVVAARAEDHVMHAERYEVPEETMAACQGAARVVAVGTTTVRALETAAATGQLSGTTTHYIYGDYRFLAVDALLTNFHQPRSSLLLLLEAFCGPRWRELYTLALSEGYRFLSFGDAMLVAGRRGRAAW